MALVERVLRIAGEQETDVRGDGGAVLVLLPGQPSRGTAAVVEGETGAGQFGVEPVDLGALLLQLLLGGVVRLRGLFGTLIEGLKIRQELGDRALSGRRGFGYGGGGQRREYGA